MNDRRPRPFTVSSTVAHLRLSAVVLVAAALMPLGCRDKARSSDTTQTDSASGIVATGDTAIAAVESSTVGRRSPATRAVPPRAAAGEAPATAATRADTVPPISPSSPVSSGVTAGSPPAAAGSTATSSSVTTRDTAHAPPSAATVLAFAPGEKLTYDVKFGPVDVGNASMEVVGIESVRGVPAYHTVFRVKGGTFLYKVDDKYESWFDARTFSSMRYYQSIDEGHYERERRFELFPERAMFQQEGKPEQPSVSQPLDDGSFIYFLRSIPLEVGKTYTFERYFRPDKNPVTIRVVRRERVKVPAGTFDAVVVRPVIKTTGIFAEGGKAEIWLADDSTRVMLQMQSKLSFGSLNLYLKSVRRGTGQ